MWGLDDEAIHSSVYDKGYISAEDSTLTKEIRSREASIEAEIRRRRFGWSDESVIERFRLRGIYPKEVDMIGKNCKINLLMLFLNLLKFTSYVIKIAI